MGIHFEADSYLKCSQCLCWEDQVFLLCAAVGRVPLYLPLSALIKLQTNFILILILSYLIHYCALCYSVIHYFQCSTRLNKVTQTRTNSIIDRNVLSFKFYFIHGESDFVICPPPFPSFIVGTNIFFSDL